MKEAIAAGAQTERRGKAWPVRDLLGGETSPAVLLDVVRVFNRRSADGL
jgi:hypothetical protein